MTALVIDASAALEYLAAPGEPPASPHELHAPRLLQSEVLSALHAMVWRRVVPADAARQMLHRLGGLPLSLYADERLLHERAWAIADELGWAKTYDAEYVALAQLLGIPLLTFDVRLARGAERVVDIARPADIGF